MATHYYDATGMLVLKQVTPVINALFGAFQLDASYPGDGQAYIAIVSEENNPLWDDVRAGLTALAGSLGLVTDETVSIQQVLNLLAGQFAAADDEAFRQLVEQHVFEGSIELDALFLIATHLDDGHHLQAIHFEGCWHCSKPRLFEFGGAGHFLSRELNLFGSSLQIRHLGEQLHQAIVAADVGAASALIVQETIRLLLSINNVSLRKTLQLFVAERLAEVSTVSDD